MIIRFYYSFRSPFAGVAFHRMSLLPEPVRTIVLTMPLWPDVIFGGHMDNPTDNLFKTGYVFKDAVRQAEKADLNRSFLD